MKIILLFLLIICIVVWVASSRRGSRVKIWYDGSTGKLSVQKHFSTPATISIIAPNGEAIIEKEFPENEKFLKIPIRGELPSDLYTIRVTSDNITICTHLKVRGCLIKIVYRNRE